MLDAPLTPNTNKTPNVPIFVREMKGRLNLKLRFTTCISERKNLNVSFGRNRGTTEVLIEQNLYSQQFSHSKFSFCNFRISEFVSCRLFL